MRSIPSILIESAVAGAAASVLSAATMAAAGRRDAGSALAPINAESHWLWGDEAAAQDGASARYTLTGYATNHGACMFWAALHALARPRLAGPMTPAQALVGGAATSALAAVVDYNLVPDRFTPGFEKRLSTGSTVGTFAAIALGIALGSYLADRLRR